MREINIALKNIGIRKHNEVALNANLHGSKMEYKRRNNNVIVPKLSSKDEKIISNAIAERFGKNGRK